MILVAAVVLTRLFVLNFYTVPSAAMLPAIRPGQFVWGFRLAYSKPSRVRHGEIIFHRQEVNGQKSIHVKRVIGLPGDRVRTQGDRVWVNEVELPHRTLRREPDGLLISEETSDAGKYEVAWQTDPRLRPKLPDVDLVVPANEFFLLGDNRTNSYDSRYLGCVPWRDVRGEIWIP